MRCPCCGRNETGQVGNHEFYCWNCCVEFHGAPGQWRLFSVDTEGMLVELADAPTVADGGTEAVPDAAASGDDGSILAGALVSPEAPPAAGEAISAGVLAAACPR